VVVVLVGMVVVRGAAVVTGFSGVLVEEVVTAAVEEAVTCVAAGPLHALPRSRVATMRLIRVRCIGPQVSHR
jgi:hypothetical protein